jgi:hypothetical protein
MVCGVKIQKERSWPVMEKFVECWMVVCVKFVQYLPSARHIAEIGKSLPISWIRVKYWNGELICYFY